MKNKRTVWVCMSGLRDDFFSSVQLFRSLAGVIDHYGFGGLYSWRSRRGNPDEFEYGGVIIKRYEI